MSNGKVGVLLAALVWSGISHAQRHMEPNAQVRVSQDQRSVLAILSNPGQQDIFCDTVEMDVVLSGRDFNDFDSHLSLQSGPVYIGQGKTVNISEIASASALASQGVSGVSSARIETDQCRAATFADYCLYASKSEPEKHATEVVLRLARRDCDQAEKALNSWVDLSDMNLRSVVPLGFLKNMIGLSIEKNFVEDLSPLRDLPILREVNVSRNPVKDLTPVLGIISMRYVAANHTLIESITDPIAHLHKRKIVVEYRHTPLAKRKRK